MKVKKSRNTSIEFKNLPIQSRERCTQIERSIETKLDTLNKLEIISRLSILTQTQTGRSCLNNKLINDMPCLQFIIGLSLKNSSCSEKEPSAEDIDEILTLLTEYFSNLAFAIFPPKQSKKEDEIVFRHLLHTLIRQINPEKYPGQMKILVNGTFGHFEDYFQTKYGFTIKDAEEFSHYIVQSYENSINNRKKKVHAQKDSEEQKFQNFYSNMRDCLEIQPDKFCVKYDVDIKKFLNYLNAFSCSFGSGEQSYLSPFEENEFSSKPILRHNDRFYAPIPQDLFQKMPTMFENLLRYEKDLNSKIWQKFQTRRSKFTEDKVIEYLNRVFDENEVFGNLFYKPDRKTRAEVDHLVIHCDYVIILETKSGNLTSLGKNGFSQVATNLKRLVIEAHSQGLRVKKFIKSNNIASFEYQNERKAIEIEYKKNQTRFILINVTLEPLNSFSSNLRNIESLGLFSKSDFPWSINLFELDIVTQVLNSPAIFIHYLERRLKAQEENIFSAFDELTFLGFYLEHGNFNLTSKDGSKPMKIVLDTEFLDVFDKHYLIGEEAPKLKIETEIQEILHELEELRRDGYTGIANVLLDLSHTARIEIINSINEICARAKNDDRFHDFSVVTGGNITGNTVVTGITVIAKKGREKILNRLAMHCQLKKYQHKADCWVGLGIDVCDSNHLIHEFYFIERKWRRDKKMDEILKNAITMGMIKPIADHLHLIK